MSEEHSIEVFIPGRLTVIRRAKDWIFRDGKLNPARVKTHYTLSTFYCNECRLDRKLVVVLWPVAFVPAGVQYRCPLCKHRSYVLDLTRWQPFDPPDDVELPW